MAIETPIKVPQRCKYCHLTVCACDDYPVALRNRLKDIRRLWNERPSLIMFSAFETLMTEAICVPDNLGVSRT